MKMSVVVRPVGGLGNQLFMYAAGKSLASQHGCELFLDKRAYLDNDLRSWELDSFDASYSLTSPRKVPDVIAKLSGKGKAWAQTRRRTLFRQPPRLSLDPAFVYTPQRLSRFRPTTITDYKQSWRYFEFANDELKRELSSIATPSDWYLRESDVIQDCGITVGLHVRRGDYAQHPVMGVVGEEYYASALKMLQEVLGDFSIIVFSDDISGIKNGNFLASWRHKVKFVEPAPESRPIESINLMSQCDHMVIANSSFSWWGAWLGDESDRYVIYPRPWLAGARVDDRDLARPHWLSLGATPT